MGQSTLIPTETALGCAPGVVQLINDYKTPLREKEYKNACNSILMTYIYSWNCHHSIFKQHSKHQLVKSSLTWAPCYKGARGLLQCWCPGADADAACWPFIVVASCAGVGFYLKTSSEMPESKESQRMRWVIDLKDKTLDCLHIEEFFFIV